MMIVDSIIVKSDSEGSVYSPLKMRMRYESYSSPSVSWDFESKVIFLSDDSNMEGSFIKSLSNEVLSRDPSETLFTTKFGGGENFTERHMFHLILNAHR